MQLNQCVSTNSKTGEGLTEQSAGRFPIIFPHLETDSENQH
jgi:hypothetical protein